jgi:hypothetical protein
MIHRRTSIGRTEWAVGGDTRHGRDCITFDTPCGSLIDAGIGWGAGIPVWQLACLIRAQRVDQRECPRPLPESINVFMNILQSPDPQQAASDAHGDSIETVRYVSGSPRATRPAGPRGAA